jgi:hypothetical protein
MKIQKGGLLFEIYKKKDCRNVGCFKNNNYICKNKTNHWLLNFEWGNGNFF